LIATSSWWFAEMSLYRGCTSAEPGDCWLWDNGLEKSFDELAQETPGGRPGQAAAGKRGESSNSSTSGSSRRMINK
jgi:hypothetical protein